MSRWVVGDTVFEASPQSRSWSNGPVAFKVRQWHEEDHPRDRIGRFGHGGGSVALPAELADMHSFNRAAVDKWWDGLDVDDRAAVHKTISDQAAKQARINLSEEALRKVLADGRFKTVHEVAPDQAGQRRAYEDAALGTAGAGPDKLPVYGFVGDATDLDAYGAYSVMLSDAARGRATATVGDSLNSVLAPQPLHSLTDLDDDQVKGMIGRTNMLALPAGTIMDYLEIQIPGVRAADIVGVTVPDDAPDSLIDELKKRGIAVEQRPSSAEDDEVEALFARLAAAGRKAISHVVFDDGSRVDGVITGERSQVTVTTASGRTFPSTWGAVLAQTGGTAAHTIQSKALPQTQVAFKLVRPHWRSSQHPRDVHGRFVEVGDHVTVGGRVATYRGTNRDGSVRVSKPGGGETTVARARVQFDRGQSAATPKRPAAPEKPAGKPPAKPVQASVPLEPSPPSPIVDAGGVPAAKVDLAASQRNAINDLSIDDPALNYGVNAREGAAALRAKQPLTAAQAEALAAVVRARAQSSSTPKPKQNSLNKGAEWLDSVVAQLRGFKASAIPTSDKASPIGVETVKQGDVIALPGKGGKADVRTVTEAVPWYGVHKFTMTNVNGDTETRFVGPGTPLYKFHDTGGGLDGALKVDDKTKQVGDEPSALYDDDEAVQVLKDALIAADGKKKADPDIPAAATEQGPGGVPSTVPWFDQLGLTGANTDPIPVTDLTIEGYTVTNGIAWRHKSRSYLVELKPGETAGAAKARGDAAAGLLESVLNFAPKDKAALQRGLALLQGPNPADSYWAAKYNMPGFHSEATGAFGGTTIWSGQDPKPTTLAHEFGHTVDSQGFGVDQWLSQADGPVVYGQEISWNEARSRDAVINLIHANDFKESAGLNPSAVYNYVKPVTLGEDGVTAYGSVDPREDFAESVRLWMKDRRENKIGTLSSTGEAVRFSDVFPERAKVLDAAFGTTTDFNTPLRQRLRKSQENAFLANLQDHENEPEVFPLDTPAADWMHTSGLTHDDIKAAHVAALKQFAAKKKQAAAAKKAKEAAEKLAAEQAEAKAKAEAEVASVTAALESGKLDKADAKKFRLQTTLYKKKLREQGYSESEVAAMATAFETSLMHEHFKLGAFGGLPKALPGFTLEQNKAADTWLHQAGKSVHPLAKNQGGTSSQALANIHAELANRLNNAEDWEKFRTSKAQAYDVGAFESLDSDARQAKLAEEISRRVSLWAGTSGDSDPNAVVMQEAVKQEFGLNAPSAPNMSKEKFDEVMAARWPTSGTWYQRVARVMYDHTQEEFKAAGITHVSVYRGMKFFPSSSYGTPKPTPEWAKTAGDRPVHLQPINSWSTNRSTSKGFASGGEHKVMLKASFPVELVLGTARTGLGTLYEAEFVILDAEGDIRVEML